MKLRCNQFLRVKRKPPAARCLTKSILEIWQQPLAYAFDERFAAWKGANPSQCERGVGGKYDADVFNDEGFNPLGMASSELVGVNAAERIAQ